MHKKILAVLLMLFIIPIFYAEQKEEQTTQCYGDMDLTIDVSGKKIVAKVSGLENCIGEINISEGSCKGNVVCSFELSQGECYFNIPSIGTHEYFACLDMNGDGEYTSDETDYEKVVVAPYEEGDEDEGGGFSWDIIIPIGLFAFILFIIAFPLLNETIKKKKSGKKRRKQF